MWSSFRKNFECTAGIISFLIGLIVGFFIWVLFHPVLGVFAGGALTLTLMGEKITFWPKSLEQKAKEGSITRHWE